MLYRFELVGNFEYKEVKRVKIENTSVVLLDFKPVLKFIEKSLEDIVEKFENDLMKAKAAIDTLRFYCINLKTGIFEKINKIRLAFKERIAEALRKFYFFFSRVFRFLKKILLLFIHFPAQIFLRLIILEKFTL